MRTRAWNTNSELWLDSHTGVCASRNVVSFLKLYALRITGKRSDAASRASPTISPCSAKGNTEWL